MSIKALSDYTIYAKYAKYLPAKQRRENWREQVDRVFDMHEQKFASEIKKFPELLEILNETKQAVYTKKILGSQRALQFGGDPILKRNDKIYNCAVTYIDRPMAFSHIMYMLLCGCGVGFSVQHCHVNKLPSIQKRTKGEKTYVIPDSIEGWADAVGILVNSYFGNKSAWPEYAGHKIKFDPSLIRPKGAMISGGFKAPGPDGLVAALKKIEDLIEKRLNERNSCKLHPIDYYDIIMHSSDAVLSGGVRRSATICLFSYNDEEMLKAKTGDWHYKNPQRGRSNNSVALVRDKITQDEFDNIINSVKEFGEPGFVFLDNEDTLYNPCVEIGMMPKTRKGKSGVQYCNLTEINGKKCVDRTAFLSACKYAAALGTFQAAYTNFAYLGKTTEEIVKEEALLGCSITGMMDNPEVLFDPQLQREGASVIKKTNALIAKMLGINPAARTTCVKPAGCLIPSTKIKTNKGELSLSELFDLNKSKMEGSNVWYDWTDPTLKIINENGEEENITKLYVNGEDEVYDIELENGETITCTPRHRFKVNGEWKRADELHEEDDIETIMG